MFHETPVRSGWEAMVRTVISRNSHKAECLGSGRAP